jgi:hypothetical protein
MGWSDAGDGMLNGDGPADAIGEGVKQIAQEARRRRGTTPSGEAILHAFVCALNLDGSRAAFYAEPRSIRTLTVRHRGQPVRIDGSAGERWMVAELYGTLDVVAEEYVESWSRPPYLRELLFYLGFHLDETWDLRNAKVAFRKERKRLDRSRRQTWSRRRRRSVVSTIQSSATAWSSQRKAID